MLEWYLILSSSWFGVEVANLLLFDIFDALTIVGIGAPFGIMFSAILFFLTSFFFGLSVLHGVVVSGVLIGVATCIRLFFRRKPKGKVLPIPLVIVSIVIPSLIICWYLNRGLLYKGYQTKGACYGDLPFHLNLINSFLYGCNIRGTRRGSLFDLKSPFFANEQLAYPILPNFYSAVLIACSHCSLHESLVSPSFIFGTSIFIVLSSIVRFFCKSDYPTAFAPYLFLFTGGMGWKQAFKANVRNEYYVDYVHLWGEHKTGSWFQTINHILLPQRGSLFSIPIAYSVILITMKARKWYNFLGAGIITAVLPQIQGHSMIALAQWVFFYILLHFPTMKGILNYAIFGFTAAILSLPQMVPYFHRVGNGSFLTFKPLMADKPGQSFFEYWYMSLGFFFIISFLHGIVCLNMRQFKLYCPSICVFLIANFVWYQPWSLDNTKIFNAVWVPLAVAVISNFLSKLPIPLAVTLWIACSMSGMCAAFRAIKETHPLFNPSGAEYQIAEIVKRLTPPDSVWVTDSDHNNPVVCLAGRQTLSGYGGWLSSHGLDPSERLRAISELSRNPENTLLSDKFGVQYAFTKPARYGFKFSPLSNSTKWETIYSNEVYHIYKRK